MTVRSRWLAAPAAVALAALALSACGSSHGTPKVRRSSALIAFDAASGKRLWAANAPARSVIGGGANQDVVIISGTDDCTKPEIAVSAIDVKSGATRWTKQVRQSATCAADALGARLVDGMVVTGGNNNVLTCTDPCVLAPGDPVVGLAVEDGKQKWSADPSVVGLVGANLSNVVARTVGTTNGLAGLDPATGTLRWNAQVPLTGTFRRTLTDQLVLVGKATSGALSVSSVNPASGKNRWSQKLPALTPSDAPAIGSTVAVALKKSGAIGKHDSSVLVAFDAKSGRQLWRDESRPGVVADSITTAGGITAADMVIVVWQPSSGRPYVEGRDPRTGKARWTARNLGTGISFADTDGTSLVVRANEGVTVLDPRTGAKRWSVQGGFGRPVFTNNVIYLPVPEDPDNLPAS